VSSTYKLLCLNHDPAIATEGPGWQDPEPAIAAACEPAMHDWLAEDHGKCDLLVGRYSYPLIEVCCPDRGGNTTHGRHSSARWIDRDWLVLLYVATTDPAGPRLAGAVEALRRTAPCWTHERLERLRPHLGIEEVSRHG